MWTAGGVRVSDAWDQGSGALHAGAGAGALRWADGQSGPSGRWGELGRREAALLVRAGCAEGKEGRAGLVSGFGFSIVFSLFLFFFSKLHPKLFEFKLNFEFKPYAFKQNKTMHQHECNNKLT